LGFEFQGKITSYFFKLRLWWNRFSFSKTVEASRNRLFSFNIISICFLFQNLKKKISICLLLFKFVFYVCVCERHIIYICENSLDFFLDLVFLLLFLSTKFHILYVTAYILRCTFGDCLSFFFQCLPSNLNCKTLLNVKLSFAIKVILFHT
jgi:hypothetical protein